MFAVDNNTFARGREIEVIHARWALLGAIDFFTPEMLKQHEEVSCHMVYFIAGVQFIHPAG